MAERHRSTPTEASQEINEIRGEAAVLIRRHLWRASCPPILEVGGRPWHMGRDLSMWNRLVAEGNDPETINGAITVVRQIMGGITGPMTMQIFYGNGGKTRPIFEQCKSRWLATEKEGPRQFKDVLREVMDG